MIVDNEGNKYSGGIDPAQPGAEREVTHVLIPNDEIVLAQCAFCKKPAAGAVQVKDPAKPEKQVFIKACNTHKDKAMRKAASVLRRYYKKRVVIDDTPEHIKRMGAGDKKMRADDEGVVTK